jgi:membrane protein
MFFWRILRATFEKWRADNAGGMAAALAYYALFSIVPLLFIFTTILGFVVGQNAAQNEVQGQVAGLIGPDVAGFILGLVTATHFSPNTFLSVASLVIIIVGAITLFKQLKWSLDHIWKAPPRSKEKMFWRRFLPDAVLFLAMAIVGIILLAFSFLSSASAIFALRIHHFLPLSLDLFLADIAVFFVLGTMLFAALYRYLPNIQLKWKDIRAGALTTSVLFTLGRTVIGLYLRHKNIASLYGAASAIIILLLWVYYSAMIFYFGAEFTHVWSNRRKMR